mgnify:FL=1
MSEASLRKLYRLMMFFVLIVSVVNTMLTLVKLMLFEREVLDYMFLILWFIASLIFTIILRRNIAK